MSSSKLANWLNENAFRGVGPKFWKQHISLFPIFGCIVTGLVWCAVFSTRTLLYNPDSTLMGRESFERYRDGKYFKFINITGVKLASQAPVYRREGDPPNESFNLPEY